MTSAASQHIVFHAFIAARPRIGIGGRMRTGDARCLGLVHAGSGPRVCSPRPKTEFLTFPFVSQALG